MHEMGIMLQVTELVSEKTQGQAVRRLVLEIGKLTAVLPDSLQFCFEICARGTVLEGATLEILEIPGLARCQECGSELELNQPFGCCECGCSRLDWLSGEELKIRELELV